MYKSSKSWRRFHRNGCLHCLWTFGLMIWMGSLWAQDHALPSSETNAHIVFMMAEDEYHASRTLGHLAKQLQRSWNKSTVSVVESPEDHPYEIPNLQVLDTADLLVMYVRRRALPASDMNRLRAYLKRGGSLLALRTSSHAWDTRGKAQSFTQEHADRLSEPLAEWKSFDQEVLGGNYHGHHPNDIPPRISIVPGMASHPFLKHVEIHGFVSNGSLYQASPLAEDTQVLLTGSIPGEPAEPVMWTRQLGKSRIVYTSLGHPDDFEHPNFVRLLVQTMAVMLQRE